MNNFISGIGPITWFVLSWLSLYFIINIWIFIWRFFKITDAINVEKDTLELLNNNHAPMPKSIFFKIFDNRHTSKDLLDTYRLQAIKQATIGLSMLSIISSTAPFIGLFGTVIEILEAFYNLGNEGKVAFDIIAPIISKALVATAFGILTAIPAYSFYIILRRKAYELGILLDIQTSLILNSNKNDEKITLTKS